MSVINQMLTDLAQRHATAVGSNPMGGEVRSVPEVKSSGLWPRVILGLVLLGAGLSAAWWKFQPPAHNLALAPAAAPVAPPAAVNPPPAPLVASSPTPSEPAFSAVAEPSVPSRLPGLEAGLKNIPIQRPDKKSEPALDGSPADHSVVTPDEKLKTGHLAKTPAAVPLKSVTPQQKSENFYKQAVSLLQQGRVVEACDVLAQALAEDPVNHTARQLLAGLLVENRRPAEAMSLLQDGVRIAPDQMEFVMALARMQVEAGDRRSSLQTLEQVEKFAGDDAEYHGFYAALLQRDARHDEAISHYLTALRGDPANNSWLIGVGISLQEQNRNTDAREAFERARQSEQLSPELLVFVNQRLKQLGDQ